MREDRKKAMAVVTLLFFFLISAVMAQEDIDYSHPSVKLVLRFQQAIRDRDYQAWWDSFDEITKEEKFEGDFNYFKEWASNPLLERVSGLKLKEFKSITPQRAWISTSAPPDIKSPIKGFYLVKIDKEWKLAMLEGYLKKVKEDLRDLKKAVDIYVKEKGIAPDSLSELISTSADGSMTSLNEELSDPFSDARASYKYVKIENFYEIYSLGPDSEDDAGSIDYNYADGPISEGDIVVQQFFN